MNKNWNFSRLGVLFVVLVSHSLYLCSSLNDEGFALLKLRERVVSDPLGALTNWRNIDSDNDPCSWFGVGCSDGKVVELNLKDLCLEATLAPEITSLVHIKSVNLRNNSFSGIIPEGFGELKELEVLDLGYNNFSEPLPFDLGINLSLSILLLDNNELLGGLSPEIRELQMISEAQVDEDQLINAVGKEVTWHGTENQDATYRRILQESVRPVSRPPPPQRRPSLNRVNFPSSPSSSQPPSSESPFPSASATPELSPEQTPMIPVPRVSSTPSLPPVSQIPPRSGGSSNSASNHVAIVAATIGGAVLFLVLVIGVYLCNSYKVATVKPWATGLSGQLQKAFVTGVPKLKRSELESACEDFSNVIGSSPIGTVYKGTLSSGVEIAVVYIAVASAKDWSKNLEMQFRRKIDTLSKVNHKNFVNLIGYCVEERPFTRMMVFEYAPNGTLFEHLHIKESEHLDWGMRLRIAMGMAYCLEHMHQLNPPIAHENLNSSSIHLTEDYAAKLSDFSFWNDIAAAEMEAVRKKLSETPSASTNCNIYSFGVLLFEMITGRIPYMVDNGSLENWASDYLKREQPLNKIIDPTLDSFVEEQLEKLGEVMRSCVNPDPQQRPSIADVTARLRQITGITPDGAIPKLSPLWWAELEILSTEAI